MLPDFSAALASVVATTFKEWAAHLKCMGELHLAQLISPVKRENRRKEGALPSTHGDRRVRRRSSMIKAKCFLYSHFPLPLFDRTIAKGGFFCHLDCAIKIGLRSQINRTLRSIHKHRCTTLIYLYPRTYVHLIYPYIHERLSKWQRVVSIRLLRRSVQCYWAAETRSP